ncbi:hypothetical protein T03_4028 [Trichinella britovi]|uniref:Uncharacterized protein n=1 Tax=Trichinella britovi TaxID=45882 RepID=A0A0V1D304_TRIBR|nr:hypothetical protein T03_4028 [Trichinella britovi]
MYALFDETVSLFTFLFVHMASLAELCALSSVFPELFFFFLLRSPSIVSNFNIRREIYSAYNQLEGNSWEGCKGNRFISIKGSDPEESKSTQMQISPTIIEQ